MDLYETLDYMDKHDGKYVMFFDKIDLTSLAPGSRFFEAKEKYIRSKSVGNVVDRNKMEFWHNVLSNNTLRDFISELEKQLGTNLIQSELKKTLDTITDIDMNRVVNGLKESLNAKNVYDKDGNLTFGRHSKMFSDIMAKHKEFKTIHDYLPVSFEHVATNIGIYGYSIRDDVKAATSIEVFNIVADKMNTIFNDAIEKGSQNPPEFVSFSSSGGTGCVCIDDKLWNTKDYNFIYDSVRKGKMYDELSKFSRQKVIDIINSTFKTVGSRWQLYPNPKRYERFSLTPYIEGSNKDFFYSSGVEYSLKESTQTNLYDGFSHRTVDGVGSPSQYHGSHSLGLWQNGIDGNLKKWVKFTPTSLAADVNEIYNRTGKVPVAYDVTNSESRLDSHAIVEVFFKSFHNGIFKDVAEAVYYNTHNVGIYGADNNTLNYYVQKCGDPERFISGWIFTGLGNTWFYVIVQLIHEVIYRSIKKGLADANKPWDIDPNVFHKVYIEEFDDIMFFNQGDDMLVFMLPEDKELYDNIVETNPFCKIVKEDKPSMSGMEIVFNPKTDSNENSRFSLHTKESTALLKSSEKFEGRDWKHPLRSSITSGLCGKFELLSMRPVFGHDDGGIAAVCAYAKTLNLNVTNHVDAILLNLADMLYEHKFNMDKYTKTLTISALMEKFDLKSSHEIYWALSSDDIATSGIVGIEDLFILLPFERGMNSPFFI